MQRCIIVVENDSFHLALLTQVVEHKKPEARVKFCCDGQSTIAYLSSMSTDVKYHTSCCILELSLPDMHGAELVHLLRELEHLEHLKFVVFSGSIDSLTEEHARMLNGCRTVKKPSSLLEMQEQFWEIFSSCEGAKQATSSNLIS